jgi:hypothetical protein
VGLSRKWRIGLALCGAATLAAAFTASAAGSVTIGQLAPASPPAFCSGPSEFVQPTVSSGAPYVVPATGVRITSWSTQANDQPNQNVKMKVYRPLMGLSYRVVGHDGPFTLTPNEVNTFATDLPVQPGDLLGVAAAAGSPNVSCLFEVPGNPFLENPSDTADGSSVTFTSDTGLRANISAQVELASSASTGKRAAALNKCKKKHSAKKRKKCKKKANLLPV